MTNHVMPRPCGKRIQIGRIAIKEMIRIDMKMITHPDTIGGGKHTGVDSISLKTIEIIDGPNTNKGWRITRQAIAELHQTTTGGDILDI